jgi:hypothetical protein
LIHPHVERFVASEAEPATHGIELHRRHAEVRESAIDPINTARGKHGWQLAIVGMHEFDAVVPGSECLRGKFERTRISIEPEQAGCASVEHGARMTTEPDGAINEDTAAGRIQQLDHFLEQHGFVSRFHD